MCWPQCEPHQQCIRTWPILIRLNLKNFDVSCDAYNHHPCWLYMWNSYFIRETIKLTFEEHLFNFILCMKHENVIIYDTCISTRLSNWPLRNIFSTLFCVWNMKMLSYMTHAFMWNWSKSSLCDDAFLCIRMMHLQMRSIGLSLGEATLGN